MIECSCSLIGKKGQHATSTSSMSTSSGAPKIAGYRIIRQIIPGPNSKPADIERALAGTNLELLFVYKFKIKISIKF